MNLKRIALLLSLAGALLAGVPVLIASAQRLPAQSTRTIALPGMGSDSAFALAFSPDGSSLAVGTSNGIELYDARTLAHSGSIPSGAWVRGLTYSPDGSLLGAGLWDNTARLWQMPSAKPDRVLEGFGGWVRTVLFSPAGDALFTISDDDTARAWGVSDGTSRLAIHDLKGARVIALSPDGTILAIGLQDNDIELRNTADGSLVRVLKGHTGWVRSLAFSPDGARLASGAFDATARIWDVATGELEHTLSGHQSSVLSIGFSPDGATVATGSVDRTVKLWSVVDGTLQHTLQGHTGFVYSLAFSPDGSLLASGAADNSVRLWDLRSLPADVPQPHDTPKDCRACHHPASSSTAPALVQVRCDACHTGGANLNWCPNFRRSLRPASDRPLASLAQPLAGVPVPAQTLSVIIANPANGESLYSAADLAAPVTVSGSVKTAAARLADITVKLEVWQGTALLTTLSRAPDSSGSFAFPLAVNPHGNMLRINNPAARMNCASCHDDFLPDAYLPAGDLHLVVSATSPSGEKATDERWVTADVGTQAQLQVRVQDATSGQPLSGVAVQASTKFYQWRGRSSSGVSDATGIASLSLEALSQATAVYDVSVPPQVIGGLFYSADGLAAISVGPGSDALAPISVRVSPAFGRIQGSLAMGQHGLPVRLPVTAFKLPAGPLFYAVAGEDGAFAFSDLYAGRYLIFAEPSVLASHGLSAAPETVDLTTAPAADVSLKLLPADGTALRGAIHDQNGEWLPFAQIIAPDEVAHPAAALTGQWELGTLSTQAIQLTASAPGYYASRFQVSPQAASEKDVSLEPRPDTRSVSWGAGSVVIPGETRATIMPPHIDVTTGWLWGQNDSAASLVITTPEAEITLSRGRFSLERASAESAWLAVWDGEAGVRNRDTGEEYTLHAGEVLPLADAAAWTTLAYDEGSYSILAGIADHPNELVSKPTLAERLGSWLSSLGIGVAQFVTFITYFLSILLLTVVPVAALIWLIRARVRNKGTGKPDAENR